ncbi:hypothetical protein [Thermococcus zilligii]|uniref:hypothetical protein n=1 Tax=Thermococcus zilligii TaxID=54076 RepID=UPI0012FA278F|nr:hypothetical protein [Thermococcus zilligii]
MKWKPVFAVLIGLLMVEVTAGSASAGMFQGPTQARKCNIVNLGMPTMTTLHTFSQPVGSVQKDTSITPKPQVFLDEDQVHIYFSKWDSYKYRGTIYLAFPWRIDVSYVPNAGSPDRVVILIPWEVKTASGWVQMFQDDNPTVYVDVNPEKQDKVRVIQDGEGFPIIEKTIGGIKYRMKRVVVSIPENSIFAGTIYLEVRPKAEFDGVTFPVVVSYVHTWSWAAFASVVVGTAVSGMARIFFPELSPLGAIALDVFTSFLSYEVAGLLPTDNYWLSSRMFNIEVSYSAYPEKQYPPSSPPCVRGICPTNIISGQLITSNNPLIFNH